MTKMMTIKRNIQTPLEEIQEKLKTLERHPNASVEMYVWLRENIERLKEHQRHLEDSREAKLQKVIDSIRMREKMPHKP
jgi:predicted nuclease with TOPRIM domain